MSDTNRKEGKLSISALRSRINGVDSQLLSLLIERRALARNVAEFKSDKNAPIRDVQREEELLTELISKGTSQGLDAHFVTQIFHAIIDDSINIQQRVIQQLINDSYQQTMSCAYLGVPGSYSFLAAQKHFAADGDNANFLGCRNFKEIIDTVQSAEAQYGILPIENTTSGGITDVYDLLLQSNLYIVGEVKYPINHCLVSNVDCTLDDLEVLYTHPEVLSQCSELLTQIKDCEIIYANSSANAAIKAKENESQKAGALSSKQACELYRLHLISENAANNRANFSRFVIVAKDPERVSNSLDCKTSLVLSTSQKPGSLAETLLVFRDHGINITKLESRPIPDNLWEELFYVDIDGNLNDPNVNDTITQLTRICRFIRVLGSYPRTIDDKTPVPSKNLLNARVKKPSAVNQPSSLESSPIGLSTRKHKSSDTEVTLQSHTVGGSCDWATIVSIHDGTSSKALESHAKWLYDHGVHIIELDFNLFSTYPELIAKLKQKLQIALFSAINSIDELESLSPIIDGIRLPSQHMNDHLLLEKMGKKHIPIILERHPFSSVEDWLDAANKILTQGNQQVILCDCGIQTYQHPNHYVLDIDSINQIREQSHLPLIISPCYAAKVSHVASLTQACQNMGAQGVLLILNPNDDSTVQELSKDELVNILNKLARI